jgi:hypothetical protein
MGHVKALEKTSCKYPVRRVEVKVDTVPTGNMNIKSKQGVSFGIIFSRNGISFVLIHFSSTGVESHITSDVLNHVDLKIKLRRSRDAFALVADAANYKIKIKEMALYVRKVQLSPAVRMGPIVFEVGL